MRTLTLRISLALFLGLTVGVPARGEVIGRQGESYLEQIRDQRVLHLKGSYREMGFAHGKLLSVAVRENTEAFLDHWCLGGGREKVENLEQIFRKFEPFLPARYKEELEGLSAGSGVPLAKLQLLHAIPERFHCSGAAAMGPATRDGKLYHTRSLDYALDIGRDRRPQENAVLIVYEPPDGHPYLVVGWAGCIGCVTGMNARGISIGEMGSACKDEDFAGIPMIFLIREALLSGGTLDEALQVFRRGPRTCGYNFIVADGKIPDARAVEVTRNHIEEFGPGDRNEDRGPHSSLPHCLRRVNHFVGPRTGGTQRAQYDPRESHTISWLGYDLITYWLRENSGQIDAQRMIALLRMYPARHPCLHQAVFSPTDLDIWVSHAKDPRRTPNAGAQNQEFYRYNLKKLLAGEPADRHLVIDRKDHLEGSDQPVSKVQVAFRPSGDESQIPERYRFEPHEFTVQVKQLHDYSGLGLEVHEVRFPSPVETKHPENNIVYAEFYRPKGEGRFPAVIVLDILNGDQSISRTQATVMAQRGIAALFVQMPYYGPRRPANSPVRLLMPNVNHTLDAVRQTVLDLRRATAWLESRPEVDNKRLGIMGTSLGSFMAALTAEMEPRLSRVCVLLGGGGLVEAYYNHPQAWPLRAAVQALGANASKDRLAERIACADPITHAANLRDRKLLLIGAKRDDVVPPAALEALWEATGKPRIIWYDCTHTGAVVHIVPAMQQVVEHFRSP